MQGCWKNIMQQNVSFWLRVLMQFWNITYDGSWILMTFIKKVKCSRYRPDVAQKVGRGIALLFHDGGTRRGWVVSSMPRPHFTPGKDPVPILQEAGWAPRPVWTDGKSCPHRDSIPDRPARSQSLYRLSYPALSFNFTTLHKLRRKYVKDACWRLSLSLLKVRRIL